MSARSAFRAILILVFLSMHASSTHAGSTRSSRSRASAVRIISLTNGTATCAIAIRDSVLVGDSLELSPSFAGVRNPARAGTDAGFELEIMWTAWKAPGKNNNGENPIVFGARDFRLRSSESRKLGGGGEEARLTFQARESPLTLVVTYRLDPGAFYVRRKLALSDTTLRGHFLQFVSGKFSVSGRYVRVIHEGGFGQPVALLLDNTGTFFGVEYPAADNTVSKTSRGEAVISCRQEIGKCITGDAVESSWTVFGATPDARVKYWFFEYVNHLRVAPLTPYALYNSWYDLRAPEMVKDTLQIMNEANVLRIVRLIRENMIRKQGIHLDAFVLDDGWDVYKSDWVLRPGEFPRGLRPIADALAPTGTKLGIWFGPIGGYSHRHWRVDWMKEHGYETVNDQLCLAGANYSRLFGQRAANLVEKEGVQYFKWDGIQFSCSNPTHGHPVGIFSRRAVLESLIEKCRTVRAGNPDIYLNITSGTWLSPWWVQFANQIWMQGADYGYADVPSYSKRDAAMTYRDLVLYDDLRRQGYWFPVANLMTHGIIKGNLQRLGSAEEPLEKFTDDVLLYFARGISMYELYISPDILSDGEWNAMGKAMLWARDRFPILSRTEMVGGDPGKREPYGYVHWRGRRGIVAARNPWIDRSALKVRLDAADGLDAGAANLVLERVYPTRWVAPRLYRTGDVTDLPLEGFETAVYELYPLEEATRPLIAGVQFDEGIPDNGRHTVAVFEGKPVLLNPLTVSAISVAGKAGKELGKIPIVLAPPRALTSSDIRNVDGGAVIRVNIDPTVRTATVALLVKSATGLPGSELPRFTVRLDDKPVETTGEEKKGAWVWFMAMTQGGDHRVELTLPDSVRWNGSVSAWLLSAQETKGTDIVLTTAKSATLSPMPPRPWPAGEVHSTFPIGECVIERR